MQLWQKCQLSIYPHEHVQSVLAGPSAPITRKITSVPRESISTRQNIRLCPVISSPPIPIKTHHCWPNKTRSAPETWSGGGTEPIPGSGGGTFTRNSLTLDLNTALSVATGTPSRENADQQCCSPQAAHGQSTVTYGTARPCPSAQ